MAKKSNSTTASTSTSAASKCISIHHMKTRQRKSKILQDAEVESVPAHTESTPVARIGFKKMVLRPRKPRLSRKTEIVNGAGRKNENQTPNASHSKNDVFSTLKKFEAYKLRLREQEQKKKEQMVSGKAKRGWQNPYVKLNKNEVVEYLKPFSILGLDKPFVLPTNDEMRGILGLPKEDRIPEFF